MRATRSPSSRSIRALAAAAFASALAAAGPALAGQNLQFIADGVPSANTAAPPATADFAAWCAGRCFPTTQFPVYDPGNRQPKGIARVWGRDFVFGAGGSLCFSEFITFSLDQGELHIASGPNGTCGAPIDPALKPPRYVELGATVVIAGGGDGAVLGGTGSYAGWSGTFSDRVFVGFGAPTSGVGGIVYYDQLWFSISRK
ncbi:hypothetical protein ACPOLB_26620 [Rubrivivax sp. RP6-9]|uniref:hypothetical protein n=1 Tax=Rubrivivax sp. RP6-9 TaxID=3415750 RepID=UPI003CC5E287